MTEGKTNMFGKTYNTIGSADSNFIIKTKGDLKIQWGNRFIDLIKNGKIVSENASIIQEVASSEEISSDGIYVVTTEEGSEVWVSVGETKIQLSSQIDETTYVSFMIQQDTDNNQKQQALTNIGFYYNSLDDLRSAKVTSGIFYVLGESKLYVAKDGSISEYINTLSSEENKQPLYIQDYSLYADGTEYITCNNKVYILKELEVHNGIASYEATDITGFRLYINEEGKSIIDVDIVNERSYTLDEIVYIYSEHTNYILSSTPQTNEEEENYTIYNLRFPNRFIKDDSVIMLKENKITESYDVETKTLTLRLDQTLTSDFTITLIYDETKSEHVFPKDTSELILENIESGYTLQYFLDGILKEYKVVESQGQTIQLNTNESLIGYIYKSNAPFIKIENNRLEVNDRSVLFDVIDEETGETVQVPDETIHTKIGPIKEEEIEALTQCPTEEEEITQQQDYESAVKVGIYSDNFIGLNSKLYNPIFKKRCDGQYPKYDELLTIPEEDRFNEKYDQVVPNIGWIKQLLNMAVPAGTIVMWSGTEIPDGWAICDGNNGTPNLIGKFIKASDTANQTGGGGNHTVDGNNNYIKLGVENLPDHTHGISELTTTSNGSHTHEYNDEYTDWSSGTSNTYDVNYIEATGENTLDSIGLEATNYSVNEGDFGRTTGSSGSHSHTIPATSTSGTTNANNTPFSIEPSYFSLIFIMKLDPNIQQN